ncbi:hypothetical protein [Acinetobacter rudis]|uniref:Uncharacterized protein n=1 Tax=Acinetobacter rudis TaxID=632955 RepID=A0AAW8JCX1_9GAMM|nr:hypothetical protein [Acinetobacter rudis]MDQ8937049.1 hypothetical protein [Acinetobacter rudis]MDQ9019254.1 hypothetical protein [Acinetobacter rudis]
MLDHNEKLKLITEYLHAGVTDAGIIIQHIKKLEQELFAQKD